MKKNVGPREQLLRIGIGSAALTAALVQPRLGGWRWGLGIAGVMELGTGLLRWCPISALLGIDNTRGEELVHFDESLEDIRGRAGQRINQLQRRMGASFE
jgi:hypothetical protein